MYLCIFLYMCICLNVYMYICIYVHIHIYIYTHRTFEYDITYSMISPVIERPLCMSEMPTDPRKIRINP